MSTPATGVEEREPPGWMGDIARWYADHARDLPWRRPGVTAWEVLVSEVMLQQTPVSRVLPVYREWIARWPSASALANEPVGEAVRAWGRLGYPRRALALHATARICHRDYTGHVPDSVRRLRKLPGVGDYTAAAVASFAFGQRHAVLDTNVRRVYARVLTGRARAPDSADVHERDRALALLPEDGATAARYSVAVMELGALVCTVRSPSCTDCPVATVCTWHAAGCPPWDGPPRRAQRYTGTDRQCRGKLLAVLRDAKHPIVEDDLLMTWPDQTQAVRALHSLVVDGLVSRSCGRLGLPD